MKIGEGDFKGGRKKAEENGRGLKTKSQVYVHVCTYIRVCTPQDDFKLHILQTDTNSKKIKRN